MRCKDNAFSLISQPFCQKKFFSILLHPHRGAGIVSTIARTADNHQEWQHHFL